MTDRNFPRYYILVDRVPFAVDMDTWAKFFANINDRRVAHTVIDMDLEVSVSTVFLGLDHNFSGGDPLLFETMSFGPFNDGMSGVFGRYRTWVEAEKGHAAAVAEMTALVERAKAQSAAIITKTDASQ